MGFWERHFISIFKLNLKYSYYKKNLINIQKELER